MKYKKWTYKTIWRFRIRWCSDYFALGIHYQPPKGMHTDIMIGKKGITIQKIPF